MAPKTQVNFLKTLDSWLYITSNGRLIEEQDGMEDNQEMDNLFGLRGKISCLLRKEAEE